MTSTDQLRSPGGWRTLFNRARSENVVAARDEEIADGDITISREQPDDEHDRQGDDGDHYGELDEEPEVGHDGRSFAGRAADSTRLARLSTGRRQNRQSSWSISETPERPISVEVTSPSP
jgi:hypothetical protein